MNSLGYKKDNLELELDNLINERLGCEIKTYKNLEKSGKESYELKRIGSSYYLRKISSSKTIFEINLNENITGIVKDSLENEILPESLCEIFIKDYLSFRSENILIYIFPEKEGKFNSEKSIFEPTIYRFEKKIDDETHSIFPLFIGVHQKLSKKYIEKLIKNYFDSSKINSYINESNNIIVLDKEKIEVLYFKSLDSYLNQPLEILNISLKDPIVFSDGDEFFYNASILNSFSDIINKYPTIEKFIDELFYSKKSSFIKQQLLNQKGLLDIRIYEDKIGLYYMNLNFIRKDGKIYGITYNDSLDILNLEEINKSEIGELPPSFKEYQRKLQINQL